MRDDKHRGGRWRVMAVAVAVLAAAVPLAAPVGADTVSELSAQRAEAKRKRERFEREVELARSDARELTRRLRDLDGRIDRAAEENAVAKRHAEAARTALADAEADVRRAERSLAEAEAGVRAAAVDLYTSPPQDPDILVLAVPPADLEVVEVMLGARVDARLATVHEADRHRSRLLRARATAAVRRTEADGAAAKASAALDTLNEERAEHAGVLAEVETRLERALAEAAALERLDKRLSERLAAAQERKAEEARAARAKQQASKPAASRTGRAGGGGAGGGSTGTSSASAATPTGLVTWADVRQVPGTSIWVHKSIIGKVTALVEAARADGLHLNGGGYRDPAFQIELRRAHCGPTRYDIYEKPASECHPPTAPPGRSEHERGLAVDFTRNGQLVTSRTSPSFVWLKANAARYGLYNLPSEPWHWSTTGR